MSRGSVAVKLLVSVQAHPSDERCPSRIIVKGIENWIDFERVHFTGVSGVGTVEPRERARPIA